MQVALQPSQAAQAATSLLDLIAMLPQGACVSNTNRQAGSCSTPAASRTGAEVVAAEGGAHGGLSGVSGGVPVGTERRSGKGPGTQSVVAKSALRSHPPLSIHRPTGRLVVLPSDSALRIPLIMIACCNHTEHFAINSSPCSKQII